MSDLLFRLSLQHAERVTARHLGTEPTPTRAWGWPLLAVSAALLGFAIAIEWLSMREVLSIGGSCATGGPYESAQECPDGTGWSFALGVPLAFAASGLLSLAGWAIGRGTAALACVAWPVAFLVLGWNFLDFGLHPAPPSEGPVMGYLVCAVAFAVMGALPLAAGPWLVRRVERHAAPALGLIVAGMAVGAGVATGL